MNALRYLLQRYLPTVSINKYLSSKLLDTAYRYLGMIDKHGKFLAIKQFQVGRCNRKETKVAKNGNTKKLGFWSNYQRTTVTVGNRHKADK